LTSLFRGRVRVHTPTEKIIVEPGDGLTVLAYSSGDRKYVAE
jgi:hypothetical protein